MGLSIGYRGHYAGRAAVPHSGWATASGIPRGIASARGWVAGGTSPTIAVTVTNTGSHDSREVVQVYFQPDQAAEQPIRTVGRTAVTAAPGTPVNVEVPTDARMWRRWDPVSGGWDNLSPGGRLVIARGPGDVRATVEPPMR
jgi:beta-glucosidase